MYTNELKFSDVSPFDRTPREPWLSQLIELARERYGRAPARLPLAVEAETNAGFYAALSRSYYARVELGRKLNVRVAQVGDDDILVIAHDKSSTNMLRAYRASLLNTANALARQWSAQSR